jgi:6-phosphogluconolactonase
MHEYRFCTDAEALARGAADHLAMRIRACLDRQTLCHVALPGGRTPARCLALLAQAKLPWRRVHWYLGDERCYPAGHAGRNDVMLETELWSRIGAPAGNRHPIAAELGAEVAAERYAEQIRAAGRLDIVLLGMGEDGHTASLFPDNAALADPRPVVAVHDAPKPPPERVSLGLVTLRDAAERIVLVSGRDKRDALRRVQAGAMLPVNRIGTLLWFIDAEAGAGP